MATDYVEVKLDTDRMPHGSEVAEKIKQGEKGGMPWSAILDADGERLITSIGPKGNMGCPVQPEERVWFGEMLRQTKKHMTDAEHATVMAELDEFAGAILDARKKK